MRIISSQLRQIIREEITRSLKEMNLYYSTKHPYPIDSDEVIASRERNFERQKDDDSNVTITTSDELIEKLTNYQEKTGEDVDGLISFFVDEKRRDRKNQLYVLKAGADFVGVFMHRTWPEHRQHIIDIPRSIAKAARIIS